MKIGIIGSGISGLGAAFCLYKKHEITIFEKENWIGGHTHSFLVKPNTNLWIDTGFIVCNPKNYPNFFSLLNLLNIKPQETSMSFSVYDPINNFTYNATNLNKTFAQRKNIVNYNFLKMLWEISRFNKIARHTLYARNAKETLQDFLIRHKFSKFFYENYIIPISSSIWSANTEIILKFPTHFLFQFFNNHGMLSINQRPKWYSIPGGSHEYVSKMTSGFKENIRLNAEVEKVLLERNHVIIKTKTDAFIFDKVIVATHSDQAIKLIPSISKKIKSCLEIFPYQNSEVTLHQDHNIMPKEKSGWAAWNFCHDPINSLPKITYHMNVLQCLNINENYFVSLNQDYKLDPNKILIKFNYQHPIYTTDALEAQKQHATLSIENKIYLAGAYWGYGFHEDGLNSGLRTVKQIDKEVLCKMPFIMEK